MRASHRLQRRRYEIKRPPMVRLDDGSYVQEGLVINLPEPNTSHLPDFTEGDIRRLLKMKVGDTIVLEGGDDV